MLVLLFSRRISQFEAAMQSNPAAPFHFVLVVHRPQVHVVAARKPGQEHRDGRRSKDRLLHRAPPLHGRGVIMTSADPVAGAGVDLMMIDDELDQLWARVGE